MYSKKVENTMSHFILAMKVKLLGLHVHVGYPHTEFRPILGGHARKFGELIWNYPYLTALTFAPGKVMQEHA
jgi:hypothetical protein